MRARWTIRTAPIRLGSVVTERERYGPLFGLAVLLELVKVNWQRQTLTQHEATQRALMREMRSLRARGISRPHVRAWHLLWCPDADCTTVGIRQADKGKSD